MSQQEVANENMSSSRGSRLEDRRGDVAQWKRSKKETSDGNGYSKTQTRPIWKLCIYLDFQHLGFRASETRAFLV